MRWEYKVVRFKKGSFLTAQLDMQALQARSRQTTFWYENTRSWRKVRHQAVTPARQ